MSRALSIHIGVNRPQGRFSGRPLQYSETNAWRMAGLAERAGYDSLLVLRGEAATRQAVHDALTGAAGSLAAGDTLFVSFSGHGSQEADVDCDEGHGWDEAWCLADGVMVDDQLAGYWRLFASGVRIVVVAESCYAAGTGRDDKLRVASRPQSVGSMMRDGGSIVYRTPPLRSVAARSGAAVDYAGSCIAEPPRDTCGIRASLLLLAASREEQTAREGLFSRHLLDVWDEGAFRGSYCDLHRQVRDRVMCERFGQDPQILMLGASDPGFPLEPAFHLDRRTATPSAVYR